MACARERAALVLFLLAGTVETNANKISHGRHLLIDAYGGAPNIEANNPNYDNAGQVEDRKWENNNNNMDGNRHEGESDVPDEPVEKGCELSNWSKPVCSCQSFLIEFRTVINKEESWNCDTLIKSLVKHKKKISCKTRHPDCAAIAYEVAHDTLNHVQANDHYDNAARVYRLAGGRGNSRNVVQALSDSKAKLENEYSALGPIDIKALNTANKAFMIMLRMYFAETLPKANPEQLMKGMKSEFESIHAFQLRNAVRDGVPADFERGDVEMLGLDEERPDVGVEEFDLENVDNFKDRPDAQVHEGYEPDGGEQRIGEDFPDRDQDFREPNRLGDLPEPVAHRRDRHHEQRRRDDHDDRDFGDRRGGDRDADADRDGDRDRDRAFDVEEEIDRLGGELENGREGNNNRDQHRQFRDDGAPEFHDPSNFLDAPDRHHNPKPVVIEEEYEIEGFEVEPVEMPLHNEHAHHHAVSRHPKTTRGDVFFFIIALGLFVGLSVLAMATSFTSPWLVLGASAVDFWVMAAFYWIDVRTPYNIDHYEHAGMMYDAFAITCVVVVLFAAMRASSAVHQMTDKTGRRGNFPKLDILAAMGLLAQLTVLCIHVITTTHASRTVIAGFVGTILSTVIQTWHLIHQNNNSAGGGLPTSRSRPTSNLSSKYGRTAKRVLNFTKKSTSKHI